MDKLYTAHRELLLKYFGEISAIPRESGNESAIADYLVKFADERGLWSHRDTTHNVLIKKDGNISGEPLLLQAHSDMVCEKNEGTMFDFARDGLKLVEVDGWLTAEGTTLGADNGSGMAMMLAILGSDDVKHPPLECLFTAQEEVGLVGVEKFDFSHIAARRMINLDSSSENIATIGCAGGAGVAFERKIDRVPHANQNLRVQVRGLFGGHSGSDIHHGRGNAIKILAQILSALYALEEFNLVSLSGGGKNNAIPRESQAVISVLNREEATARLLEIEQQVRSSLISEDADFRILVSRCGATEKMATYRDTRLILSQIQLTPNGVLAKWKHGVQASSNLGVAEMDGDKLRLSAYLRSHNKSVLDATISAMGQLCKLTEFELIQGMSYPHWEEVDGSMLAARFMQQAEQIFGSTPVTQVYHAGLECGVIISKLGGACDAISIGPETEHLHTPDERMNLESFAKTYELVLRMIGK